ncbi:nuclear transport factor 2 family protein [Flavobacterium sp.]|uniref:nuclear transport factor 2 family protein n=1 Tax=Flavobacterium sp. TaxID=239 RepID=UPI0025C4A0A4|nr:nuclear transport factor 2 family protein [Flavobacterium sp.]MBA4153496.1 nuclear transport factor 2 family protein [Flavobacterium sp.]
MKKILILLVTLTTMVACQNKVRYTQKSAEIETYKKSIKDYEMANWESMATHYADTAKIMNNVTKKKGISVAQNIELNKKDISVLSSYGFVADESEYEMVETDKGETWVNFWGLWQGRLKATDELFEIPVHLTARFINGKIVSEYGYWDNTALVMALMKLEEKTPTEEPVATTKE